MTKSANNLDNLYATKNLNNVIVNNLIFLCDKNMKKKDTNVWLNLKYTNIEVIYRYSYFR